MISKHGLTNLMANRSTDDDNAHADNLSLTLT